jgi:hypothetical protein
MPIYQNNQIEIDKLKDKFTLVIKKTEKNHEIQHFWNKTSDIIEIDNSSNGNKKFTFKAYSIETLSSLLKTKKNKISYRHGKILFINFLLQLNSLEKNGFGIINLDLNDFIVINKDKERYNTAIVFINSNKIYKLENNHFIFEKPSEVSKLMSCPFNSPEIENIKNIPVRIHKKTIYYSIGKMITYCINNEIKLNDKESFEKALSSIFESKLYYGLMRCIIFNPHERYYLYI